MRCPWARGRVFTIEKWYTTGMTVTCGYAMAGKWSLQSFTVWWKRPCVITYLQVVNRSSRRADMLWVALYPSWCPLWQCASRPLRVCSGSWLPISLQSVKCVGLPSRKTRRISHPGVNRPGVRNLLTSKWVPSLLVLGILALSVLDCWA